MLRGRINSLPSLRVASGLVLGICGGTYIVSRKPCRKTAKDTSYKRDIPILDEVKTQDRLRSGKSLRSFNPDTQQYLGIFSRLVEHQQSTIPPTGTGIARYDVAQIASNSPSEDDHAEYVAPVPGGYWSMFGIFDGHSGWETSAWLRENLLVAVTGHLADLYSRIKDAQGPTSEPTSAEIETTFKTTFKEVDDHIVYTALELAMSKSSKFEATNVLAPAYAGSCALVSFYDSIPRLLHVALTGDSRAILGRCVRDADGNTERYEVLELSVDQNAHNAAEESRLLAQHPGEAVVKGGRVLGWGVSRAFGDARMKWSLETQKYLKETLLGRSNYPTVKTPPYFTAEPEVVSVEIQPGDFLIMASDGLWESLTNEEAVGLVGWWLQASKASSQKSRLGMLPPSELPVNYPEEYQDATARYRQWNIKKLFITADENAATHLIRNALGGADEDLVAALLSMRSPRSRSYQ